jgi:hypothetical protein
MSRTSLPRLAVKRWPVTILGLLITAALAMAAISTVKPTYTAQTSVLLVPPVRAGQNPFLALGGLEQIADVASRSLADESTANALLAKGLTGTYALSRDQSVSGPIVAVVGKDRSAAGALAMMRAVADMIGPKLTQLQNDAGVRNSALLIQPLNLTTQPQAVLVRKSQQRATVAAAAFGLFITLMLLIGAERWSQTRSVRRQRRDKPARDSAEPDQLALPEANAPLADVALRPATDEPTSPEPVPGTHPAGQPSQRSQPRRARKRSSSRRAARMDGRTAAGDDLGADELDNENSGDLFEPVFSRAHGSK